MGFLAMGNRDSGDESPEGSNRNQLWILWDKPTAWRDQPEVCLSFLPPSLEEEVEEEFRGRLIHARNTSRDIRASVRAIYINLVARIGTVPDVSGLSFRRALARPGEASRWWYHPVAFKDCESDPTFQLMIAVHAIQAVAEEHGLKELVFFGGPSEVAEVLKGAFAVKEVGSHGLRRSWWTWICAIASRARYGLRILRQWFAIHRLGLNSSDHFDVAFSGYWDWSVWWEPRTRALVDRYFCQLPNKLIERGILAIGWFVWLDPQSDPKKGGRGLATVLAPLKECGTHIVVLQALLGLRDIVRVLLDFQPLKTFLRIQNHSTLRQLFQNGSLDYYCLFEYRLLRGFLNANLPHGDLVALATERACQRWKPRVAVSFQEHFPYARAHYEGVRRAGGGILSCAIQHASYNHEKTFLFLHPSIEFNGDADGCPTPHPDHVYAMGPLGQELFLECGYHKEQVLVTGSPRYDHVGAASEEAMLGAVRTRISGEPIRLLMVTSLDVDIEMDMVDAVCAAAHGVEGVQVCLRNHPLSRLEQDSRFNRYREAVELTVGSLGRDLQESDLVIYTYSTVAEEALLQCKPVWQWLPLGFNGSALAEVVAIPQFGSVKDLRAALLEFQTHPLRFIPSQETVRRVFERLFHPDGTDEIAKALNAQIHHAART